MSTRQHDDLAFGTEFHGFQSVRRIKRAVQYCHVGLTATKQSFLLAWSAQEHVDGGRTGFGGVSVEQFCDQLAGCSGLGREDQNGLTGGGAGSAPSSALSGLEGVERRPALSQQHRPGFGQSHPAAVAFQQLCPEAAFELMDRPRERGLRHLQPLRGPPEVQLLSYGDEVAHFTGFHAGDNTRTVSIPTQTVLAVARGASARWMA
jgi:hypothetical protein